MCVCVRGGGGWGVEGVVNPFRLWTAPVPALPGFSLFHVLLPVVEVFVCRAQL